MNKRLEYFSRSVYGNFQAYLIECPEANAIRALTGRKTLTQSDIDALTALGFELILVNDPKAVMARPIS